MKLNIFLSLAMLALLNNSLMAGFVYEIELTDHESSEPTASNSEIAIDGSLLKMTMDSSETDRPDGNMIWRGDRREMIIIDNEGKSYMVMDEETVSSLANQMGQVSAQMAEALKNVPEEQRAMVEEMMKKRMPKQMAKAPLTEIIATGETADKNGYPCVKYIASVDGRAVRHLWVTGWENIEGGDEATAVFLDMSGFFEEMMNSIGQAMGGMGGGDMGTSAFEQLNKLNGFPVVTEELADDGSLKSRSELRSTREEDMDPAAFEAPAGYKRRSMMPQ